MRATATKSPETDFTTAPEVIEARELAERAATAVNGYRIATPEQYVESATVLRKIKAGQKRLEELRTAITKPLNAALKAANDLFRAPADQLAQVERQIKAEINRYDAEQERIRREEQRRAEEVARREREAAEAKARAAREKADAEAAELRRRAEEEAAAGRAAEAAKLAAKADSKVERAEARADALELQAASVVAPVIQREAPKVAGIAKRTVWLFEVTDPAKVNPAFTIPDEKKIRKLVNSLGADAAPLLGDGVRVWSEQQIAAGAA